MFTVLNISIHEYGISFYIFHATLTSFSNILSYSAYRFNFSFVRFTVTMYVSFFVIINCLKNFYNR